MNEEETLEIKVSTKCYVFCLAMWFSSVPLRGSENEEDYRNVKSSGLKMVRVLQV